MGKVSGLWCPVGIVRRRLTADQLPEWPVKGHWVKTWTVHDLQSATPDQAIAIGNVDGIVLDETILGPVLAVLENCGMLMDLPPRQWAKRVTYRTPTREDGYPE